MGTLAPAAQYELPTAFFGLFGSAGGNTFMLLSPTVLLVAGVPEDGVFNRLYVEALEIGGDGSLTSRGSAYAYAPSGSNWQSVAGVLMSDGTVLIPLVTQDGSNIGLYAVVVTWDDPGISLTGAQELESFHSGDSYFSPSAMLNPDGVAEFIARPENDLTEKVRRISVSDTLATLIDTYTFDLPDLLDPPTVEGGGVSPGWYYSSAYGSHSVGVTRDISDNPTTLFATRAWGSTTVEYFNVGAGDSDLATSLGGETYAIWSAQPLAGTTGEYWVVTKDGLVASSSALVGQEWFGEWPASIFDLTNKLALYLSENTGQALSFGLADDGTPIGSTIVVDEIIDYADGSLDTDGAGLFPVLGLPGYWACASAQWVTILHPYVVKTTQLIPLRRGKRNDGLGPSGHPRLRSSGTMTSTQLASAPRVGGGNLYS